jgi:hypothetical protein
LKLHVRMPYAVVLVFDIADALIRPEVAVRGRPREVGLGRGADGFVDVDREEPTHFRQRSGSAEINSAKPLRDPMRHNPQSQLIDIP